MDVVEEISTFAINADLIFQTTLEAAINKDLEATIIFNNTHLKRLLV